MLKINKNQIFKTSSMQFSACWLMLTSMAHRLSLKKDNNTALQIWDVNKSDLSKTFKIQALPHYILIDTKTKAIQEFKEAVTLRARIEKYLMK
jgi:thioredoxin-related protein